MDMDKLMPVVLVAIFLGLRSMALRRFWILPLRYGRERFFTVSVPPGFWDGPGALLLRRYRTWLAAWALVDLAVVLALIASGYAIYAVFEQVVALVITAVFYNLTAVNFAVKARALVPADPHAGDSRPVTAVNLSLEPRRLRDHTVWAIEAAIAAAILVSLWLAFKGGGADGSLVLPALWLLYLQAGLLLLKRLFVRWRMRLPAVRTEDYRKWRTAWLSYHLRVFDAMRLLFGIVMLYAAVTKTFGEDMTHPKTGLILLTGAGAAAVLMIAYCIRERRRLARVEGALRPVEMVKEFPPPRADSGRFMAGGLLYFNRENPVMIARGAQGIALNLAHPGIYVWVAYLSGLVVLTFWQFRA